MTEWTQRISQLTSHQLCVRPGASTTSWTQRKRCLTLRQKLQLGSQVRPLFPASLCHRSFIFRDASILCCLTRVTFRWLSQVEVQIIPDSAGTKCDEQLRQLRCMQMRSRTPQSLLLSQKLPLPQAALLLQLRAQTTPLKLWSPLLKPTRRTRSWYDLTLPL
jgi:hypothetical protein